MTLERLIVVGVSEKREDGKQLYLVFDMATMLLRTNEEAIEHDLKGYELTGEMYKGSWAIYRCKQCK